MSRKRASAFLFLFLMLLALLTPRGVLSQEREVLLDKILNPLPEYDPFEKPSAPPKYFPDEVDKRARQVLIDGLTNRRDALEDHLRFLKAKDDELANERGAATGLTGQVQQLVNATIEEREAYLAAQKRAAHAASSPARKKYLDSIVRNDELTLAQEMMSKSSSNRWGAFFNRLLSSIDLVGMVTGAYVGAAVDTTMSQLFALSSSEMPVEERKALAHYLEHLRRYPFDPRNPEIWKQVDRLEDKKKRTIVEKQLERGREAMGKGDLDKALFHYEVAAIVDPDSKDVERAVTEIGDVLRVKEEERRIVASATAEKPASPEEKRDLTGLLLALTLRDPEQIEVQAKRLQEKYRGETVADSAWDSSAVALELKGQHEEAKKVLTEITRSADHPDERRRAALLLESPEYNLLSSFQDAQSRRRLETVKFVLLGEDLIKRNLIYGTGPLVVSGPAGAPVLAAANVLMIGSNLFEVLTSNPVSNQAVIDKGVAYIRSHPQSESATDVYRILAEAYEEKGMYNRAIAYHEMSGKASREKITELKDKAGKGLLQAAARAGDRTKERYLLKTILDEYPESSAAQEATRRLAALVKTENQGLRISKRFLMENPELYGPQGLGLKATLFDGNVNNMELADRGVNHMSESEILLYFQTPWGVRSESYPLRREVSERFYAALRKRNYELALTDADSRPKGSLGGIQNLPLAVLKSDLEKQSETPKETGDTTFTFVREAGGGSPPHYRVLDHELLSENERDPGSKYRLPPIQGSISASRFDLSGSLPTGLWGDRLMVGTDQKSPFAGVQLPIPLLQGFIPVGFLLQGRPGGFSVFPRIHTSQDQGQDQELYR